MQRHDQNNLIDLNLLPTNSDPELNSFADGINEQKKHIFYYKTCIFNEQTQQGFIQLRKTNKIDDKDNDFSRSVDAKIIEKPNNQFK